MRQRWLSLVAMSAVVALAFAGCDRPSSSITGPAVPGPRVDFVTTPWYAGSAYLLTGAGTANQTRSAVIGKWGGKINFGPTSLQVPAGAVANPTRFTFVLQTQPYIAAKLSAQDTVTKTVVKDFPFPLTLTLSYAASKTPIPDVNQLAIYYVVNGLVVEKLTTTLETKGQKVIAPIRHFSEYSPGFGGVNDNPCGTPENPCP